MKKINDFCSENAIVIALIAITIIVSSYIINFYSHDISKSSSDWGTLGDFIGGTLNPLLSFLALIVLLRTFNMQREELSIQREELQDTKTILKIQSETQIKQQFESTFFALLNVHNQILSDLYQEPPSEIRDGRTSRQDSKIESVCRFIRMKDGYFNHHQVNTHLINSKKYPFLKNAKKELIKYNNVCGNYFRTLYQSLKFIKNNAPVNTEKTYSNIVRALLTDDVMELLVINCYCENEQDAYWQYKLLIERYTLFEHAIFHIKNNEEIVSYLLEAQQFYDEKAFNLAR